MAIPEHNPLHNHHHYQHEELDQWLCPQFFRTVSSDRPPILNLDNCSCVEVGVGGGGASPLHPAPPPPTIQQPLYEHPLYSYDHTTRASNIDSAPPSLSNTTSVEGETMDMNMGIGMVRTNTYLPLGPDMGLNEAQNRRSASFESEMSYQMKRFLVEDGYYHTTHDSSGNAVVERDDGERKFLKQDVNIGYGHGKRYGWGNKGSMKVKKGSEVSWVSDGSGAGQEEGVWTVGARCVAVGEMGGWVEGCGAADYGGGDERSMVLSGFSEYREGN